MPYTLERKRIDRLSKQLVLEELRRVAKHYGYRRFSRHEFDSVAEHCKGTTVIKNFGSWQEALDAIGVSLKPHKANRQRISDEALLEELGRIWSKLGHRPSKVEWEVSDAKYSYTTYKSRFEGWLNACARFIEFASGRLLFEGEELEAVEQSKARSQTVPPQKKRYVPLKLRLQVLKRDNFKCVYCGKSPATHLDTVLHIDHIVPFSQGGKTELENLQTLCEECNWGKGNETQNVAAS